MNIRNEKISRGWYMATAGGTRYELQADEGGLGWRVARYMDEDSTRYRPTREACLRLIQTVAAGGQWPDA